MLQLLILSALLALGHSAVQCDDWEFKDFAYLGGWMSDRIVYPTIAAGKERCLSLGDNCGGITNWGGGWTMRSGRTFVAHSSEKSYKRKCTGFRVSSITPNLMSVAGGTRVTINGAGFSTNQFSYDDSVLGNKVVFSPESAECSPITCTVLTYYTSSTKIVCDTGVPTCKSDKNYRLQVSVDGTWMERSRTNTHCGNYCRMHVRWSFTPVIESVTDQHIPTGSVIRLNGKIFSNLYAAKDGESEQTTYIKRVYLNALNCNPTNDTTGDLYGTALNLNKDGDETESGYIKCVSDSPGPTSYRPSFLNTYYGRSHTGSGVYKVDSAMRRYAVQSYNEIASVSPVQGSTEGGTAVTINGNHFTATQANIDVKLGGVKCDVQSYTSQQIICKSSKIPAKDFYPGNRGVYVEYWNTTVENNVRAGNTTEVRFMNHSMANFVGESYSETTYPSNIATAYPGQATPYYMRMRFFIQVQETDEYGFSMVSEHRAELYVSTDDTPGNLVLKKSCLSHDGSWTDKRAMTAINTTLEAGKMYYVEYLALLWNQNQRGGVGLVKKTTPFTESQVRESRQTRPNIKFTQDYNDEEQEINLNGLINKESTGFVLTMGGRETKTLFASSKVDDVAAAITEMAVFQCPTLDAADSFMSVGFEDNRSPFKDTHERNQHEPFCGRWCAESSWELYRANTKFEPKVLSWSPAGKYKNLCFALKSTQKPNLYIEVNYQKADYKYTTEGFWRDRKDMTEWDDVVFDGTWKYLCIDIENRIKVIDWDALWKARIGTRSYSIVRIVMGIDQTPYFTDAVMIVKDPITESKRVKAPALSGPGLLEKVTVTTKDVCNNGSTCTTPTQRVWNIKMKTHGCAYDFPMFTIKSATAKKTNDSYISYTVGGVSVAVKRVAAITKELLGTFDLTVDGVKHSKVKATTSTSELLALLKQTGEFRSVWQWGTCYDWHYRFEYPESGYRDDPIVDISNMIGSNVKVNVYQVNDDLGGLRLFPIYGDWIQTAKTIPQVAVKVDKIAAGCSACDFTTKDSLTPTLTALSPTSGTTGATLTLTGTAFGTDKAAVSVTIGSVGCTVKTVTDTSVTCTVQDNSAEAHSTVKVNVAGKGDSKNVNSVAWTQTGEFADFTPKSGSEGGGTVVTLTGTGFRVADTLTVQFASVKATMVSSSYTKIVVVAPAGTGAIDVIVKTAGGDMTHSSKFTYTDTGIAKISGVSPNSGPVGGGTEITISGENLDKTASVTIGGVVCVEVSKSTTEYKCTTGSNDPGADNILLVTATDGNAAGTVTFTYKLEVSAITPSSGSVVGGTVVTIKGRGFGTNTSDVSVTMGAYSCNVTTATDQQLLCETEPMADIDLLNTTKEASERCIGLTLTEMQLSAQTLHNDLRLKHKGTPTLCYSHNVAKTAVTWATYMAANMLFKSSSSSNRNGNGENLNIFKDWSLKSDAAYIRQAIVSWYSQKGAYDVNTPTSAPQYTQLIWYKVTEVGCAVSSSRPNTTVPYTVYVVCHYSPIGNIEGEFSANVKAYDPNLRVVAALPSKSVAVSVFVSSHKATKVTTSSITPAKCTPYSTKRGGCNDVKPTAASGDIPFTYYACKTPLITNVTYQTEWDKEIIISGSGFTSDICTITVKVGGAKEHTCVVRVSNAGTIKCTLDPSTEPPVYTKMMVHVHISGLGDAVFSGDDYNWIYTSITPSINSLSPIKGSGAGGTTIEIKGGGFVYADNTITGSVNDGSQTFTVISATYTTITVKNTGGVTGDVNVKKNITLLQSGAAVACDNNCGYTYDVLKTAKVTSVSPMVFSGATTFTLEGTNLCSGDATAVKLGSNVCALKTCTAAKMTCEVDSLPSANYPLTLTLANGDGEVPAENRTLKASFAVLTTSPTQGSLYGGTMITLKGTSMPATLNTVTTGSKTIKVLSINMDEIILETVNREVTKDETDNIRLYLKNGTMLQPAMYYYRVSQTPNVSSISPEEGTEGDQITIVGTKLAPVNTTTTVVLSEGVTCSVDSATDTEVKCTLSAGEPKLLNLRVHVNNTGYSRTEEFQYLVKVTATVPVAPTAGSLGGPAVTIKGSGFNSNAKVYICNTTAGQELPSTFVSSNQLTTTLPASAETKCSIMVAVGDQNSTLTDHVTYDNSVTPTITAISPGDAGTGGNKMITITGTKFIANKAAVKFDGVACAVQSSSTTEIKCLTGAKADLSNKDGVEVRIDGSLTANPNNLTMKYQDKWSSKYTWGGGEPPVEDDLAVIQQGQIIYLDADTPKLKALLIRGGHLIFDDNQDITLRAEYILVLDGGSITIGTEAVPFQNEATVMMYGNQQSYELPMYGAKTLAVRNGTVDFHGKAVTPNYCSLGETAKAGSNKIIVNTTTNWKVGDLLAISTSSFSPTESEEFNITKISESGGRTTIELSGNFLYDHLSLVQDIRGTKIETAAKVGHLTRNVKMRGNVNWEHVKEIDACPQEFDPDQFASQTCFQGRYGSELDSDQFGAQIMFHAAAMHTREVLGRLENTEFTWSGQAFRLGRYAIHFHMNGDVSGSYVKGCAIHHSFNRAVTVHGVDNLLIKDNVAFNIMGHSFFLEDGGEEHNIFEGNLAIFTRTSSSLLNVDVTPAAFWIVNPQNTFVNNIAAGCTHFGFWFNMPQHPGGPSADSNICPRNKVVEKFDGNSAHSCGRYGIWMWEHWTPKGDGSCQATATNETTISGFHAWHNLRGIEIVDASGIRMENFTVHDNFISGVETHDTKSTFEEGNTKLTNSVVIAKTASSDGLALLGETFKCSPGIVLPRSGKFSVHNLTAHDYTECTVLEDCGGCKDLQGGFPNNFEGITYLNSPKKAKFKWIFSSVLNDLDGTLTGTKGALVTHTSPLHDPSKCTMNEAWGGDVCDATTKMIRIAWNKPSLEALSFKNTNYTNEFGTISVPWRKKRLTHAKGWMALLPAGKTYDMNWDYPYKFTNASLKMGAYYPKDGEYVFLKQILKEKPDYLTVGGNSKKVEGTIPADADPGSFSFDDATTTLTHIITGKGITVSTPLAIDLKIYKCYYENCTDPNPKPLPTNPAITIKPESPKIWSVSSDWVGTAEGMGGYNGYLPSAGQNITILSSWWMIYDMKSDVVYDTIFVYGVLEFSSEEETKLAARRIIILGGKLVVGWAVAPLKVKATISLKGDRSDKSYTLNDATECSSKSLNVFGYLEMHAEYPSVTWTQLTASAAKGATTLTLKENVEGTWKVGDDIAIASTSYDASEAERRTLTAVSGHTVTLDSALEHDHEFYTETVEGHVYTRTAEVGLLTRLITIEGDADGLGNSQRYGARMLVKGVTLTTDEGERAEYPATAQIQGVRFKNSGQEGYRDDFDPRYSLTVVNTMPSGTKSYVKGCSIDVGYNHGFGLLQAHNMEFKDNVAYNILGSGMRTVSDNTIVDNNLVIEQRHFGIWPLNGNKEENNLFYDACFDSRQSPSTVYTNNAAAGCERVGFYSQGEDSSKSVWNGNTAHSCQYGLFIYKTFAATTIKLNGFSVWSNFDFGLVYRAGGSVIVSNSIYADNIRSFFIVVGGPHPLAHSEIDKTVTIEDSLIYGRRPSSAADCSEDNNRPPMAQMSARTYQAPPPTYKDGRVGYFLTSFSGNDGAFPGMSIQSFKTYSSIKGSSYLNGVTFARFDRCNDMAMKDVASQGDCIHPTFLTTAKFSNINKADNLMKLSDPKLGFVNSADCVDMPCDAKKKVIITDTDGSVFGTANTVLTSIAEFEWNGDSKWGIGDYRLPNTLTSAANGSFIDPAIHYSKHGIVRTKPDNSVGCAKDTKINMYKCTGIQYRMMVFESLDGDTEIRRISPVALSTEDGYVDLINGPMDHGWCGGYTCQQRISTFYAIVALNKVYKLHFTSTMPQSMRYHLLGAQAGDKIRIDTWYAKPQRLDVYYKGKYKAPTNAKLKSDGTYSYVTDKTAAELYPKITSNVAGENFFDSKGHFLSIMLKGPDSLTIRTSPTVVLSLTVEDVTVDDFFKENIINNLAALLGVPKEKIKIAEIVAEGGRKRATGATLKIEISEPAVDDESSMNSTTATSMAEGLEAVSNTFVSVVQKGQLSKELNVTVKEVSVQLPEAPPVDSTNITVNQEDAEKTDGKSYAEREAEAAKLKQATDVKVLIPHRLLSINTPTSLEILSNTEINTNVVTEDGTIVPILGVGKDSWKGTISINTGPTNGRLLGSTQVTFSNGYANFTDVRFSKSGDYNISIKVTFPTDFPYEMSVSVTAKALSSNSVSRRIQFTFNGDYDTIVDDRTAFMASFKAALLVKFPGTTLADMDAYKGSVIVEVTVTSESSSAISKKIDQMKSEFEGGFDWSYNGTAMKLATFDADSDYKAPDPDEGSSSGGVKGWTIALAVILAIVVVVLITGVAFFVYKKKMNRKTVPDNGMVMSNKSTRNDASGPEGNEYGTAGNKAPNIDEGEDNWLSPMQKVWKTVKRHEGEEEKDLVQELEDKFDELEADLWRSDPYEWSSCKNCEKERKTWPCPICRTVRYCSKECQQEHWPEHFNGQCKPRTDAGDAAV